MVMYAACLSNLQLGFNSLLGLPLHEQTNARTRHRIFMFNEDINNPFLVRAP